MSVSLESLVPDPLAELPRGASTAGQLVGFLLVGGAGAVAFVVLSTLAIDLHTPAPNWLMSTLCYACLIGPVYLLHRRFSFPSEAPHRQALPRYVGVQLCALLLASLFGYLAYHVMALPTLWASLFVTGLTSGVNFMVLKLWAFAHRPREAIANVPPSAASVPSAEG